MNTLDENTIFDSHTYKRLQVIKKINPSFSDSLLNYLITLPRITFFKNIPYTKSIEIPPYLETNFFEASSEYFLKLDFLEIW